MLGLYVHIPFCARRCPYCDFAIHVGADAEFRAAYLKALRHELKSTLAAHAPRALTSIFFGGGTPTSIGAAALNELLRVIRDHSATDADLEVSLEANPEDLAESELHMLRAGGWNRLSLGAQSLDDAVLKRLGRKHTGAQVREVMAAARRVGFDNISLDFIYAVPGQTTASWRNTLEQAVALAPEHVSCYSLTIEADTAFARRVQRGRLVPVPDDTQAEFMQEAEVLLASHGLQRYEISNYARAGYECRHNLNYWRGGDYLACGCGAHGHLNGQRWWNERSATRYVALMQETGSARAGEENLTPHQRLSEIVMLGLRLREGFRLSDVSQRLHLDAGSTLKGPLNRLISHGLLVEHGDVIQLAPQSMPIADAVAVALLQ